MNRRTFLDATARLALAGAIAPRLTRPSPPLPAPFLDAHVHPESAALIAHLARSPDPEAARPGATPTTGATLVDRLNADGVRRAFVLSTAYQIAADYEGAVRLREREERAAVARENDFAAAQCARFPDRLVPFLSVNPRRGYAVEEIDRCVESLGMRGLKLHLWNSLVDTRKDADLSALVRVVGHAARRGLPVVAHIYVGDVRDYDAGDTERFVREVVAPFDTLRISIAHLAGAGGFAPTTQRCFERLIATCGPGTPLARRVWTDLAYILLPDAPADDVARFAELAPQWGFDRMLWGSDGVATGLAAARARWPLGAAAWQAMASNRGEAFAS